jgi:probable rRNA maturation factor
VKSTIIAAVPLPVSVRFMKRLITRVGAELHCPRAEASVLLCDNKTIRGFNRRFLKRNRPTDVIAFYTTRNFPADQKNYIGDLIVSVEQARRQAQEQGHSLLQELRILIIHGMLHLKGYQDTTPALKKKMFKRQEDILNKVI